MSEPSVRIYAVTNGTSPVRLVRAESRFAALRHVMSDYRAEVAGQDALMEAVLAGIKVEVARTPVDLPEGPA